MSARATAGAAVGVEEYRDSIEQLLRPLAVRPLEIVPVSDALGRLIAEDVRAPVDLPVFRNSSMDGYAVRAATVQHTPTALPLAGVVAAGEPGAIPLPAGGAWKVMTGAPIPPGADCVIPVEDTRVEDGRVIIERGRDVGDFIREPGTDVRAGDLMVSANTALNPRHIAALAAVGVARVGVFVPVRAAVITTGDELVPAGMPLRPGQIYNSNGIALAAALATDRVAVVSVEHSTDDPAVFSRLIAAAAGSADVVFTSGGVSQGDFEVVKEVLAPRGGRFGSVAMQPGGPQGLSVIDGTPVLSFPGNPVSTLVSYEVLARPALRRLAGLPRLRSFETTLTEPVRSPAGRRQFLRGRMTEAGVATVSGPGSHLIASMAQAEVLIDVAPEITELAAGAPVRVREL